MNSIKRVKQTEKFTVIPNIVFKSGLSLRAIGLLSFILHLPDDWVLYKTYLYETLPEDGRDAIKTAWKELEDKGYIETVKTGGYSRGKVPEINYIVYDLPQKTVGFQSPINQQPIDPPSLTRPLLKTKELKTNKQNTNQEREDATHPPAHVPYFRLGEERIDKTIKAIDEAFNDVLELTAPVPKDKARKSKFEAPTQLQCHEYFINRRKNIWPEDYCRIEADKFFNHYEANGWVQGKGKPIKKWESAANGWMDRAKEFTQQTNGYNKQESPAAKSAPVEIQKSNDPAKDLQYMYDLYLENQLKPKFIDASCYDWLKEKGLLLKGEWIAECNKRVRSERIKSLTGSNNATELAILRVYSDCEGWQDWQKIDPGGYARAFKKIALLMWFGDRQRSNVKILFA